MSRAPYELWVMLGECQSKCDHLKGSPLAPELATRLYDVYLAKGVQGTAAIEGNTLSEAQVLEHIEGKLNLPPSLEYLEKEVDNILQACNDIGEDIYRKRDLAVTVDKIRSFNRLVLKDLTLEDGVVPGKISNFMVTVGKYRGCPREDCAYLLEKLADWLNGEYFLPNQHLTTGIAVIKAIMAHLYLAWIHPFGDGNGRTARLVEFQILNASGVPAPAAHLLSNFYNRTRTEYYRQLDAASKSGGDVIPFILYAVRGFRDGLREQIESVKYHQWETIWINHVHKTLSGDREGDKRRRNLLLDLSKKDFVPINEIKNISPRIALAYATKTPRTLLRDLELLRHMNLVLKNPKGYRANRGLILAWRPRYIDLNLDQVTNAQDAK